MRNFYFSMLCLLFAGITSVYAQQDKGIPSKGFALFAPDGNFQPYEFTRHAVGDNDIQIKILYSGICHSDIHTVRGDWGDIPYPAIPGHEIVGEVVAVGKNVTKFKVGDYAGVGCMVNSCGTCTDCKDGEEQYCKGVVWTYSSPDFYHGNEITQGGYSNNMVVADRFAIKIPRNADLKKVAPLMCAGITTYSPIHFSKVKKGDKVAVAGFGGLGHLAVQYLVKLGAEVTVFDITEEKRQVAADFGAMRYVNVNNPDELKGLDGTFSFILSTIPSKYDLRMYVNMLRRGGEMAIVGRAANDELPTIDAFSLIGMAQRKIYGSLIGSIQETQEMLDYSVANNIYPEVVVINADGKSIDEAYRNVVDGKVQFRYVIDMSTLK